MILREHYLRKIRPFYDSDLVKILTGIRRCGKSVILDQIAAELRAAGKPTLFLNFELRSTSAAIPDCDALVDHVESCLDKSGSEKTYVFLDEVQLVRDWHLACRSLRLRNLSLFISGSNARLLSRELTKELSGRYVAFVIRPFVYKELAAYAAELGKDAPINEYLVYGGMPKRLEFDTTDAVLHYLSDLDETIVMNDIMNRYKVRKEELFRRLVNYVLVSNARVFSANAIQKYLSGQRLTCSVNTVMKYLHYLEEAYVIRSIPRYSTKARRELTFYEKIYNEDVAFNSIRQSGGRFDLTHNLENVVYNELIYMGYELAVFNLEGREIDFLAEKEGRQYLIQAAYSIADEKTHQREFDLFNRLDQSRRKLIVTLDDFDFSTSTVTHVPLKDFLMLEDLDALHSSR